MNLDNMQNRTNTINVTVPLENGEAAYFTIEFAFSDFDKVVDQIENVTIENIYNNPLWKVL